MALFDFLKKREILEIATLKKDIEKLSQYREIKNIDEEIAKKKAELEDIKAKYFAYKDIVNVGEETTKMQTALDELKTKYVIAYKTYQKLQHQNELYSESLDLADYGVYEPHFDFDASEQYKEEIIKEREKQKELIKSERAVIGGNKITWNNSLSQGQAMVKREKKLMMRAFNGECDSFIASVEWNNVTKMEERIKKSFEAINKIYATQGIEITTTYQYYKIHELHLAYEYKKKKQEEKEEQRAIREQMREEEKAAREYEAARVKAEKEEAMYQRALDKVKEELLTADDKNAERLSIKIKELEARLEEAEQNKQRAISMAQQTKRGHVYIISNIGSFGENVYKIGMTRRLEPIERVKELSDASVPFAFDVHAMIFSEDAPKLERDLHLAFDSRRLNAINNRKEFFNVTLGEIEEYVKKDYGNIDFIKTATAEEYHETLAITHKRNNENTIEKDNQFPETIL